MNTPSDAKSTHGAIKIPLCIPELRGNEWKYVKECLDTGWVSSVGAYVDRFERQVADSVGCRFAVAAVNGTSAIHVALRVVGVEANDEVLVSALTFIAPANAVRYLGAWPVFMDAEPRYWQMDPEKVRNFLEKECRWSNGKLINRSTGRRVAAILPVHILGHPVDMDPVLELARRFELPVVEDATEGLGSLYKGLHVGHLGDAACFSFNGNKIVTTGGGGMFVSDREELAAEAKYLTTQAKDDPIEYRHEEIGYNYRMTNVQAAMGCAQMEQLDSYVARKREVASQYRAAFEKTPGVTPAPEAPWARSTFWMYTALIDAGEFGVDSRHVLGVLRGSGIECRPLWQPMHLSPAHRTCQSYHCEVAARLNRDAISLPCSVGITDEEVARVIASLQAVHRQ